MAEAVDDSVAVDDEIGLAAAAGIAALDAGEDAFRTERPAHPIDHIAGDADDVCRAAGDVNIAARP